MTSPISSAPLTPEASVSEQSRKNLQSSLDSLGNLGGSKASPEVKAKKLREACEGFESIFIQKMWQEMRNAIPKSGLMQGREERFWQDMYDQELAKSMTSAGGIGLADMMFEQLSRNLISASRGTATYAMPGAFEPEAAPLLPTGGGQDKLAAPGSEPVETPLAAMFPGQVVPSVYDGQAPQVAEAPVEVETPAQAPATTQPATAQAAAAPQNVAPQPVQAPAAGNNHVAHTVNTVSSQGEKTTHKRSSRHYPDSPDLAQIARRDAGDKLGSRAVRPALRKKKEHVEAARAPQPQPQPAPAGLAQAGNLNPGSPEALAAAMNLARSGVVPESASPASLNEIVAQAKARNQAAAQQPLASQAAAPGQQPLVAQQPVTQPLVAPQAPAQPVAAASQGEPADQVVPVTRRVRYSTNIPQAQNGGANGKKSSRAIRMLNVDNVGVNSRAGQGIAAYHATRDALAEQGQAGMPIQPVQPAAQTSGAQEPVAPARPISPLTARDVTPVETETNLNIPPLKAGELRS